MRLLLPRFPFLGASAYLIRISTDPRGIRGARGKEYILLKSREQLKIFPLYNTELHDYILPVTHAEDVSHTLNLRYSTILYCFTTLPYFTLYIISVGLFHKGSRLLLIS